MATHLVGAPISDRETVFMRVRREIEEIFHSLMEKMNERREVLLRQLNQWEEDFNRTQASYIQSLEEIQMEQLIYPQIQFNFDRNSFNDQISNFGSLTQETDVKNYTQIYKPNQMFGKFGKEKSEFSYPRGMVIDCVNQRMFISDYYYSRIQVWSLQGYFLSEFGSGILQYPWEIVLCGNFIFITDFHRGVIYKWCLLTLSHVKKSNTSLGTAPSQFKNPSGLDVSKNEIFVVEFGNRRISVFDLNLEFKRVMADKAINESYCLRVRNDIIYVLERKGVIKLFSKSDQLLKTIPKLSSFSNDICSFNFDFQHNFLITDRDNNSLFRMTPDGELLCSIQFADFKLNQLFGVAMSEDGKVFVSFQSGSNAIALLSFAHSF